MDGTEKVNDADRPLRVGYVSTGFYSSPGARFFLPVLKNHDSKKLFVTLYFSGQKCDRESRMLSELAWRWQDITDSSNRAAADAIRADGIDVLVDMDGQVSSSRLPIFAFKPAPVQVTYHGAHCSTGIDGIDYRLADRVLAPLGEEPPGHEQIVRLNRCFYAYCPWPEAPPVSESPAQRNGYVTFGVMHRIQKWTPITIDLWCEVLRSVPNSRILVNAHDTAKYGVSDVREPFRARGIDVSRIIVPDRAATVRDYLHLYDHADVFLDSFPFSGATTVCDALWQGVPVVALRGDSFIGRMSESILTGAVMGEWVATSKEDYVRLAKNYAGNISVLAGYRRHMRSWLVRTPLWDGASLARELERVYFNLFSWYVAGKSAGKETGDER